MKKVILTALAVIVAVGGATASVFTSVEKQPANVYTYYLEGECTSPQFCSSDFDGALCEVEFQNVVVYDSPGCTPGHEVSTILGKRPL